MTDPVPLHIPLLNPNEPEALLTILHIQEGQYVVAGETVAVLETTKATHELVAGTDGYAIGLRFSAGETVRSGEVLCYIGDSPDQQIPEMQARIPADSPAGGIPDGLRISTPALKLAQAHGIDLNNLPAGPLITKETIQQMIENQAMYDDLEAARPDFDPRAIIVYGGGGHGKAVIDLLRALGTYQIIGIIDDGLVAGEQVMGVPVLGGRDALDEVRTRGVRLAANAVGGIGNVRVRANVFEQIHRAEFVCPALIHPAAFVEHSAQVSSGVQVFPLAYVGSAVSVDEGVIINTGAIISHDCQLGKYANIAPGAILAGEVIIGARVLIGMGVTINLSVQIGAGARVGNGATVKTDVPPGGVVRAGSTWPEP